MSPSANRVEDVIRHPLSWFTGGVVSTLTVLATFGIDPITATAIAVTLLINNAMTIFTGASILGFTIGPQISGLPIVGTIPTWPLKAAAIVFGLIAVAKIIISLGDSFMDRLRGG